MLLMLSQWLQGLSPEFGFFRVFQYLTFRAVMAAMTALLIGLVAGPKVSPILTSLNIGQAIRLTDFSRQELDAFGPSLTELPGDLSEWLDEIHGWTGGHPW